MSAVVQNPIFLVLVLFLFTGVLSTLLECPQNEVPSECEANKCQNTCKKPKNSLNCNAACKKGCICIDGYLRNDDGVCIPREQCGKSCKGDPNSILSDCYDLCPINCGNKDFPPRCPAVCKPKEPRCACKPGYILDFNATKCIQPKNCKQPVGCKGDPFAVRSDQCELYCEPSCDNPYPKGPCAIPAIAVSCKVENRACKCINGYVKNLATGKCVKIDKCPETCSASNKTWTECITCPEYCPYTDGQRVSCDKTEADCHPGCECSPGYMRNFYNQCVELRDCPPFDCTEPNKVYSKCGDSCPKTCDNTVRGKPLYCMGLCFPACICAPGFVKDDAGNCIEPLKCSCEDPNAIVVQNPNPCSGGTCAQPKFASCKMKGPDFGCQCKSGYLKVSSTNSTCIPAKKCPKKC